MRTSVSGRPSTVKFSPKMPGVQVVTAQVAAPVPVGLQLVDQHGPLLTAVPGEVALPVAVDVAAVHATPPVDRVLPHAGVHGPALPRDVAGKPDVDRDECAHALTPLVARRNGPATGHATSRSPHH
jgi:hypothetical protein